MSDEHVKCSKCGGDHYIPRCDVCEESTAGKPVLGLDLRANFGTIARKVGMRVCLSCAESGRVDLLRLLNTPFKNWPGRNVERCP